MVGIVDFGMGNLLSVYHGLEMVGAKVEICRHPEELKSAERLILPGVGAFRDCMRNLEESGFRAAIEDAVLRRGKPILGICLGMQAMARRSFEGGECAGLGWFNAEVVRLQPATPGLRVPQIGWNDVGWSRPGPLTMGLPKRADFYFVHSYFMRCTVEKDIEGECDYGGPCTAAVAKDNIFATQFHPEKSQDHGLRILNNFLKWKP